MPRCQPVECVYQVLYRPLLLFSTTVHQDFYGGDSTRITSYGRRRREAGGEAGLERWRRAGPAPQQEEELLVTHAFTISDKFDKNQRRRQEEAGAGAKRGSGPPQLFAKEPSFHFEQPEQQSFDPASMEVGCHIVGCIQVPVVVTATFGAGLS